MSDFAESEVGAKQMRNTLWEAVQMVSICLARCDVVVLVTTGDAIGVAENRKKLSSSQSRRPCPWLRGRQNHWLFKAKSKALRLPQR
ncbi:MAG: hypothetical protein AAF614_01640 [Chloroflexota bacterium]